VLKQWQMTNQQWQLENEIGETYLFKLIRQVFPPPSLL